MNSFSLLTTPWLPVRFKDGTTGKLAPVDLADENVVDISAPRADLQGAVWQFLLGLQQTSFAPKDHRRWDDIWEDGLEAEKLREALQSLEHAFQFGPDSPSFMQDFEALTGDKVPVASLLPEIPGAQTTKFNKDHFIKRGVTEYLCPHCSALALFSLQLNAPSGGKGYRTGLRGGGPMTTLIELQEYQGNQQTPLWRKLWINVMPQDEADLPLGIRRDDTERLNAFNRHYSLVVCASRNPRWARDYHTVQMPKEVRKARYFSRREELSDPELLSAIISRRDYYTDAWWMVAVATTPEAPYSLEQLQDGLRHPVFPLYLGRKSHPLALPLAPLLLEGNASDVLRNAYQQYQDRFRELKVSLPKLQDECWWEGEHDGLVASKILRRRDVPLNRQQWLFGERTINQGPWLSKEEPCTSQE